MKAVGNTFLMCGLAMFCAVAGQVHADDAVTPEELARELVVRLGHEQFAERENASEQLIDLGLPAMKALQAAHGNADREIRYRSVRILAVIRELDFQRRLAAFARNLDDEEYELPAWTHFKKQFGDEASARTLFVEMQKAESHAMRALDEGPKAASNLLNYRPQQLIQNSQLLGKQVELGSIAAMLLLCAGEEVTVSPQASSQIYSLCYQSSFAGAIQGGPHKELLRKLVGHWISRGNDWNGYQGLTMAMRYDLKEGLGLAEKLLKDGVGQTHVLQYGILTVAKMGNEMAHLPLLEKLLENETRTTSRRIKKDGKTITYETQVRDVALAALLKLTKGDYKAYGFHDLQPHSQYVFNVGTLGFDDPKKRDAALKKWKERMKK